MGKRVRLTNEKLNSYGTWLLTSGGDIAQFERNPVLLYMHRRGEVIGIVKDIKVENDEITGELEFDEASELSQKCKKQYEFGSLRMVSVGVDIMELSEDARYLKPGQTSPTVIKWKLAEVSLVDIGANDDAIRLSRDNRELTLAAGENPLPIIKQEEIMELKQLALMLGLPETATEAEIQAKIKALMSQESELTSLRDTVAAMSLSAITAAVDTAIGERRLTAEKKDQFIKLGQKIGLDELKETLNAMSPAGKVGEFINPASGAPAPSAYAKLSEVPADKLALMRKEDKEQYRRLYKAEYGIDCTI